MNKQFVLLALATISLNLGFSPISVATPVSSTAPNWLISQSEQPEIDVAKLSIGSIKLGMTSQQVIKILGKPQKKQTISRCDNKATVLKYPKLEIYLDDNQVEQITSSNKSHATKEGIKVGDPIGKATKVYDKFKSEQNGQQTSYTNSSYGGLSFVADSTGTITEIILLAASC